MPRRAGLGHPQLRWLHEIERLNPLGGTGTRPDDIAPPLEFGLAGLPDWPGIRIADRLSALGRHRSSMGRRGPGDWPASRCSASTGALRRRPGRRGPWGSTRPRACPTRPT